MHKEAQRDCKLESVDVNNQLLEKKNLKVCKAF